MTKDKDKFKVCEGCRTNSRYVETSQEIRRVCLITYPVLSETEQCPCITCLIKGMCLSGCDAYRSYANLLKRNGYGSK